MSSVKVVIYRTADDGTMVRYDLDGAVRADITPLIEDGEAFGDAEFWMKNSDKINGWQVEARGNRLTARIGDCPWPPPTVESDTKLAGDALEIIRRTKAFADAHPSGPLMQVHDMLRAFIHGGQVNQ